MIVGLAPVKVGHRQAKYTKTPGSSDYQGFFYACNKINHTSYMVMLACQFTLLYN